MNKIYLKIISYYKSSMKLLSYIHSRGVYSIYTDDWLEPTSESEFISLLEKINLKNIHNAQFPLSLSWNEYNTWVSSNDTAEKTNNLRSQRNQQLKNSDWVLTYDNVQTLANLDDWVKYRQVLRDLFLNVSDIQSLKMPTEPPILRKPIEGTQ